MIDKIDLKTCSPQELEKILKTLGEPSYRAKQIFQWVHKGIEEIDEMSNLSKALRNKLKESAYIGSLKAAEIFISKLDGTRKYLFILKDDNVIESVLMKYEHGNTVCVSCQVGCKMGCDFCASTLEGIIRNLTAGEILDQIIFIQKNIGERISNIVLMGSGEPLDNYVEVLKFLDIVNHPEGLNVSLRNITMSTCGLVPEILDLAKKKLPITLAISLHAPNDSIRNSVMPINRKYPINDLLKACKVYEQETNRRITFEYALVKDINDREEHAIELSSKIKGLHCHVNLIPLNKVSEREYEASLNNRIKVFLKILKENGIQATIRREVGSDIDAACGQLRRRYIKENSDPQMDQCSI